MKNLNHLCPFWFILNMFTAILKTVTHLYGFPLKAAVGAPDLGEDQPRHGGQTEVVGQAKPGYLHPKRI